MRASLEAPEGPLRTACDLPTDRYDNAMRDALPHVLFLALLVIPGLPSCDGTSGHATDTVMPDGVDAPEIIVDAAPDVPAPLGCNGAVALCGRRFNEVAYPTTHNSMSNNDDGWIAPNQDHGIERQLEDGVRAFMIDTWYGDGDTTDASKVYLCHGSCVLGNRPLVDGLVAFKTFLDAHPRDVLTLIFESYVSAADTAATFTEAGLDSYLLAQDVAQPWPTLGEMVASGRRIVVLTDHEPGTPAWYLDQWAFTFENPWSATKASELSCAVDRGVATNSLFTLNQFVSNPFPTPEDSLAVNSNPFFLATAQKCQGLRNHLPNFLSVNFYDLGDLFAVVRALNGLDESPAP